MKKYFITFFFSIIANLISFAQISMLETKAPQKEEVQKYDSLRDVCEDNIRLLVGQTVYVTKGLTLFVKYTKERCYDSFVRYELDDYYDKYYIIKRYESRHDLVQGDILDFLLEETKTHRQIWCKYVCKHEELPCWNVVGHYEKLKEKFLNKIFFCKNNYFTKNMNDEDVNISFPVPYKCIDIKLNGSYYAILKNEKEGLVKATIFDNPIQISGWISKDYYNSCIKRYGNVFGKKIAKGDVCIGMTSKMANEAWGNPDRINRTKTKYGVSDQWCYDEWNCYLYIKNGKVVGIQE